MPAYILLCLFTAVSAALATLISKFTSRHTISQPWVLLFYYYLTLVPWLILVPIFFDVSFPPLSAWPSLWLYGLIFFLGNALSIIAIYRFDSSTFAAFMPLRPALVALLAFWFLGEQFPPAQYLFMGVILLGAFLATLDERLNLKAFLQFSTVVIIAQQVVHALAFLFAGFSLQGLNSFSLLVWGNLTSFVFALTLIPLLRGRLLVSFSQIKPMLASGFFTVAASAALFTAFQSNLTLSATLSQLLIPPIVLGLTFFASIFRPSLLEHHMPRVYLIRATGLLLILAGAVQMVMQ